MDDIWIVKLCVCEKIPRAASVSIWRTNLLFASKSYAGQHDSTLPHSPQGADGTVIQTSPHDALASCDG
jgi:hypothetical protein